MTTKRFVCVPETHQAQAQVPSHWNQVGFGRIVKEHADGNLVEDRVDEYVMFDIHASNNGNGDTLERCVDISTRESMFDKTETFATIEVLARFEV